MKISNLKINSLVMYENKEYLIHSFDISSNTVYLKELSGQMARDFKGDALQVHISRLN